MNTTEQKPFLPFAKPCLSEKAIAEVVDSLRSGWITTGPKTQRFENMLREYLAAPIALTCNSATAGLFMVLKTLDLQPGDEVITSSMTFVATLNTIVTAGGTPVITDVELGTYNMDLDALESSITPRTRAIMPVHFAGLPVDLDKLYAIAAKHGIVVIEDAAHAIGTEYKGRRIGSGGDFQVFSFHPNKNITTGEGGCITCRDEAAAERIKLLRFHGIDREAWARFAKDGSPHYDITEAGYKFNLMDIQAALGIHQLPELDDFIDRRAARVKSYYEALSEIEGLILPQKESRYPHRHAWHLFAPRVNEPVAAMNRDCFISELKRFNIGSGVHYRAVHLSSYYQKRFGFRSGQFPNAELISGSVLSLPLFPHMTDSEQERVIEAITTILNPVSAR